MKSNNKTQIIAEEGKQELFIIREFDAPRELVFRAFSQQALLEQFFAPENRTIQYDSCEIKSGGKYRYSVTNDSNGKILCTFNGVVHEVAAPLRIIQTAEMEGLPEPGNVVLEAMLFESLPNNRTKLSIHDIYMNVATRDAVVASGMEKGLVSIFIQLDELLKTL